MAQATVAPPEKWRREQYCERVACHAGQVPPTETRKRGAPSTEVRTDEVLRQVVMHLKPELVLELAELMRPKWASP